MLSRPAILGWALFLLASSTLGFLPARPFGVPHPARFSARRGTQAAQVSSLQAGRTGSPGLAEHRVHKLATLSGLLTQAPAHLPAPPPKGGEGQPDPLAPGTQRSTERPPVASALLAAAGHLQRDARRPPPVGHAVAIVPCSSSPPSGGGRDVKRRRKPSSCRLALSS